MVEVAQPEQASSKAIEDFMASLEQADKDYKQDTRGSDESADIKCIADAIKSQLRLVEGVNKESNYTMGCLLRYVKDVLPHGHFRDFLADVGINRDAASQYIRWSIDLDKMSEVSDVSNSESTITNGSESQMSEASDVSPEQMDKAIDTKSAIREWLKSPPEVKQAIVDQISKDPDLILKSKDIKELRKKLTQSEKQLADKEKGIQALSEKNKVLETTLTHTQDYLDQFEFDPVKQRQERVLRISHHLTNGNLSIHADVESFFLEKDYYSPEAQQAITRRFIALRDTLNYFLKQD